MRADQKIEECVLAPPEHEVLDKICGAGVDPELDQLISALAHITRQKPKPLIDTLMYWRRGKGDELVQAKEYVGNVSFKSRGF